MIWPVLVELKQIFEMGRSYPWPRPECCPRCSSWRVWGHGYAARYFDGFGEALLVKCYRCPACGCVITLRPDSHFSRIHTSREILRDHLAKRLTQGRWPLSALPRSRLRHWLGNLRRQVQAHLTNRWPWGLLAGFDALLLRGLIPVARVS